MRSTVAALFVLSLSAPAGAQSINVDLEPANTPYGVPPPSYGGSAHSAGVWNPVNTVATSGLLRLDGTATGVSLALSDNVEGCHDSTAFDWLVEPSTSGADEALLDDTYNPGGGIPTELVFQGLAPGTYLVDTIIGVEFCGSLLHEGMRVEVVGSSDPLTETTGGWSGAYAEGVNFVRHLVTTTDGTITILVQPDDFAGYTEVAAIQLQQLPGTQLCFGDGSGAACPCGNTGDQARGCENSAGTGGSVLFASGTTGPDTIVLYASGERATALSIFLQGNASIVPVFYGDGLRCAGGTLKRLYTKTAVAGEVFAPQPGDPSITARSAALGVPIPVGGRRYYQVFYRDGNSGFCPPPSGDSFNVSNAVRIHW